MGKSFVNQQLYTFPATEIRVCKNINKFVSILHVVPGLSIQNRAGISLNYLEIGKSICSSNKTESTEVQNYEAICLKSIHCPEHIYSTDTSP